MLLCTCLHDPGLSKFIDEMEFDLTFLVQLYDYISDVPIKVPTQKLTFGCVRSITAATPTIVVEFLQIHHGGQSFY